MDLFVETTIGIRFASQVFVSAENIFWLPWTDVGQNYKR